jgi:uncharacterized protein YkwD
LAIKTNFFNQQNLNPLNQKRGGFGRSLSKFASRKPSASTFVPVKPPSADPIAPPPVTTQTVSPVTTSAAPVKSVASSPQVSPASTNQQDTFDLEILGLVNQERAKVGADPLRINEQLDLAADLHTLDQASMNNMSHTGSSGSTMGDRIKDAGYVFSTAGENVAYGFTDAATVMNGWMNSEGHRRNILNPDYQEIGIGYAQGSDGRAFWTQDFGSSLT